MDDERKSEAVSRRDFLRRAGREAMDTGTSLVPAARLARAALGKGDPAAAATTPWWRRVFRWRGERLDAGAAADASPAHKEKE
jgi:hypothetical protein